MATTHENREEYSSNVIRVLHPARSISPNANVMNVDNNLDYLLEDLQSSVTPANYTSSRRDVQYLSPANSTTIIRERSTSPGTRRVHNTVSYQYSSNRNNAKGSENNVDQLDTLLQDLKNERNITTERDYTELHSTKINPGMLEPSSNLTKTTHVYRGTITGNKPNVQRELIFDKDLIKGNSQNSSANYFKTLESKTIRDVSYDADNRYDHTINEEKILPHSKAVSLDTKTLPTELNEIPLSDNILPVPGTKVTTTVRTYTYEIPSEPTATSRTLLFKNELYNTQDGEYRERNVPQNVMFKTESYNTVDKHDVLPPAITSKSSTKTAVHKRDVRETNTNIYSSPENKYPASESPHQSDRIIIYNQDVTNSTNSNLLPSDSNWDPNYPRSPTRPQQQPAQPSPVTTYYYKHESSNTKNTMYGSPTNTSPYPSHEKPLHGPDRVYGSEPVPASISYKYSSHNLKSTGLVSPSEREPLLQPAPFPTDGVDHSQNNASPPRRLDDLMANFNGNAGGPVDDTMSRRREVETAIATSGEPKIPSKNVAGPPVYYPPGHEMFVKKEESSAAYRAQGGYARASGRYEYEAESKSKSKSRSGAAVVPVCLPLCCAMPCSIM